MPTKAFTELYLDKLVDAAQKDFHQVHNGRENQNNNTTTDMYQQQVAGYGE